MSLGEALFSGCFAVCLYLAQHTFLNPFSQTSRAEVLTLEEPCGVSLEASGGGDLDLKIDTASNPLLPTIWAFRYQNTSRKFTRKRIFLKSLFGYRLLLIGKTLFVLVLYAQNCLNAGPHAIMISMFNSNTPI